MSKIKKYTDSFSEIIVIYTLLLLFVSGVYSVIESKPFFDSIWWACATAMTVGYGDIYPATTTGKIIAMVWMHIVPLIVVPLIITRLMIHIVDNRDHFTHEEQEDIKQLLMYIKNEIESKSPDSGT